MKTRQNDGRPSNSGLFGDSVVFQQPPLLSLAGTAGSLLDKLWLGSTHSSVTAGIQIEPKRLSTTFSSQRQNFFRDLFSSTHCDLPVPSLHIHPG
jgi:hypothetical protein